MSPTQQEAPRRAEEVGPLVSGKNATLRSKFESIVQTVPEPKQSRPAAPSKWATPQRPPAPIVNRADAKSGSDPTQTWTDAPHVPKKVQVPAAASTVERDFAPSFGRGYSATSAASVDIRAPIPDEPVSRGYQRPTSTGGGKKVAETPSATGEDPWKKAATSASIQEVHSPEWEDETESSIYGELYRFETLQGLMCI